MGVSDIIRVLQGLLFSIIFIIYNKNGSFHFLNVALFSLYIIKT